VACALASTLTAAPDPKKISRKGAKAQKIRSSTLRNALPCLALSLRFGGFA
jgi:hypothetical protein